MFICRLEDCEVCGTTKAKYTCPKCEVRTCSLTCVNLHKKELDCDGIRDKTKFIPLTSFADLDLLSGILLFFLKFSLITRRDCNVLETFTISNNI